MAERKRRCEFCGGLLDYEDLCEVDGDTEFPCGCQTGAADWDEHLDDFDIERGERLREEQGGARG